MLVIDKHFFFELTCITSNINLDTWYSREIVYNMRGPLRQLVLLQVCFFENIVREMMDRNIWAIENYIT